MGSNASVQLNEDDLTLLVEETQFSRNQLNRLFSRFVHLDKSNNGHLSRDDLQRIPELAINPLCDRIVNAFFDKEDEELNFRHFVRVLARFRPIKSASDATDSDGLNNRDAKLRFIFDMYDLNHKDEINQDGLVQVLKLMVGENIPDDKILSIAMRTISEVDGNGNGTISFEEFKQAMHHVDIDQKMSIKFLN